MEPLDRQNEEALLRKAILAGDEAAWESLYVKCFDSLYRYIERRTCQHSALTEDIVQECWMIAVRRIRHFDPSKGRFVSWLFGIADNQLRNEFRRRSRSANVEYERASTSHIAATPDEEDESKAVICTLTKLPTRYEAVLRAKYEQKLTVAQIAVMWGQTQKSIESLLSRARAQFRAIHERSIK